MILCCGEALIDMLPRQTQAGEAAFAPYPGGAVFNTSVALGRLGAPVSFFSGLSDDLFGDMLRDALAASQVDATPVHTSSRPTTLAFVKLVDGQATYAFYDENTAGRMVAPDELPNVNAQALFFGGISLVGDPCGATYETLMLRSAPTSAVMLDPNIRPSFIKDEPAYRARLTRMLSVADIVKVSDEDLEWITGDTDPSALLDMGIKLVCMTEGAKGVRGLTNDMDVFVPANKVEVADTVGAGDTFNAGLLASLHKSGALTKSGIATLSETTLTTALAYGAKAAAITVSRAGANPPWATEL
ncbi:carbohydrate kinase [Aestuariibius sp. HNIBRBA575]|uniref:carbohydrate kinase family protein n=1 Tax=Aestuariibius sp. HNIBRBA575 TaxID=3233343 RepID=UPI0034A401A3